MPMTRTRGRRGTSLVEVLVALPIAALVSAMAVAALLQSWRLARHTDAVQRSTRELRHSIAVLVTELRPLHSHDVTAWSDSLLEFDGVVGRGVVCRATAGVGIEVLPANSHARITDVFDATPQLGDAVHVWRTDGVFPIWSRQRHAFVAATLGRACDDTPQRRGHVDGRTWRLRVADPAAIAAPGTPLVVTRRIRYQLYRSGSAWFLGRRSWSASGWDGIQPVAGPLHAPALGGLQVRGYDAHGQPLAAGDRGVVLFHLVLRAPGARERATGRIGTDSAEVEIALRGAAGRASVE